MTNRHRLRITLTEAFFGLTAATLVAVALLLYGFLEASRRSILETAEELRRAAALRVEHAVAESLRTARDAARDIEDQARRGVIESEDPASIEKAMFGLLLDSPGLSDIAFTHAVAVGFDDRGQAVLSDDGRWEIAVYRTAAGEAPSGISTRRTTRVDDAWVASVTARQADATFQSGRRMPATSADDPTHRPTFVVAAAPDRVGRFIWSDLHWSELDAGPDRRVVMTVQKAVADARGRFVGVVRVGLLTEQIDAATRTPLTESSSDPHRVFLCDSQGRLLSRLGSLDRLELSGDDLRVHPDHPPPEVIAALALPILSRVGADEEASSSDLVVGGRRYLVTFRGLAETQDWIVGIVVPEDHYTGRLQSVRDRFLLLYLVVAALAVGGGLAAARSVRLGLRRVEEATARLRTFDFSPASTAASFRDVEAVLDSLERAKTAMRALGKYTPLDLVKQLVRDNVEPKLGGHLAEVTVMFSDIRGFTNVAEQVSPDELAERLGAYLEAMTTAIRATGGTIDKFIGDGVMALWNAPTPLPDHALRACRAVIACNEATAAVYASARWRGLPPLVTRFGIHTDRVLVGHFGAPERMSYTALGDGVNLAARLEALGKQYGVTALVSEAVVRAAGDEFAFRRVDKVAVKGKSMAVVVYELLGPSSGPRSSAVVDYEAALDAYFARAFVEAIALLERHAETDGPARVLLTRCQELRSSPPPADWDGVFVATSK